MRITNISIQARNPDRVNVSIDGKYRFSLDVFQVTELGIKTGQEVSEGQLAEYEQESQFGKLYGRALEYCMMRPHSAKEVRDYLWRKTLTRRVAPGGGKRALTSSAPAFRASKRTQKLEKNEFLSAESRVYSDARDAAAAGDSDHTSYLIPHTPLKEKPGIPQDIADKVYQRLLDRGYLDDEKFARYWVENRSQTKGASRRKLAAELAAKGVSKVIVDAALQETERSDMDELQKVIMKKRARYPDENKFIQYLMRQGFSYDDIKSALSDNESDAGTQP